MAILNATQPRRFLFVLWDGGGNVPPQLAVARCLATRGHDVRVLAPGVLKQRTENAGATFVPYTRAPEHDSSSPQADLLQDWAARTPLGAASRARDRLMVGTAEAFARDVLAEVEARPADVVVTDYLVLGAMLGAEQAGIPTVALVHHIYPFPDRALPPFGMGFQPATGVAGRFRDAIARRLFVRFYNAALPRFNEARSALGLAPLGSMFELFARLDRVLVLSSLAFDFPAAALPANVRYVGPPFEPAASSPPWQDPWAPDDPRPLVVVSMSTTVQRQEGVLRRVITALNGLPVRALVTVGPAVDPASYPESENVIVRSFVPHQQVFPRADLVITHGGHGTVLTALASGVPVLCLPMGRDQGDIAARVVWRGAGLSLSPRSKLAAIREAVQRLLDDPRFREEAGRIGDRLASESASACAIEEVERLAAR